MDTQVAEINPVEVEKVVSAIKVELDVLHRFLDRLSDEQLNKVPYAESWTPGQLVRHIIKSMQGIGTVLTKSGKKADRDPGQQIPGLEQTFLDFSTKMKSPDYIVPENKQYEKAELIKQLDEVWHDLKQGVPTAQLDEFVEGFPAGEMTKWEMLNFILVHTKRHLHQMEKICEALD